MNRPWGPGIAPLAALRTRLDSSTPGANPGRGGLALVAAALVALFAWRHDNFLTADNASTIALNMTAVAIAVIGSSLLIIAGHVDLSIGSMYGLLAVIVARVAADSGGVIAPIVAGLFGGVLIGVANGVLVRWLKISPLIVTVGLLAVYRGLAYVVSEVSVFGFSDAFLEIGRGSILGVHRPVAVAAVVFVAMGLWLTRSVGGLRVYAIGGDPLAAERSGIPVGRTVVALYGLNGLLIGLVAVLTTARLGSGNPSLAIGFEFDVLTAAILGGVAFTGGVGRPLGIFTGVAVIGILNSGLVFEGLEAWWQQVAKGAILLVALSADQLRLARAARRPSKRGPAGLPGRPDTTEAFPTAERPKVEASREAVFEVRHARKSYGPVTALNDGSISVHRGEVVCLAGDNGAGKSTLVKIMAGAVQPDEGQVLLNGQEVRFRSPRDAREVGCETVFQDLALCANLSVVHAMILGREPRRKLLGLIPIRDDKVARQETLERLAALGIHLRNEHALVGTLSGGQRQCVAIARALRADGQMLCLDEPTAALGVTQTAKVLQVVRSAAAAGLGVVIVSHDVQAIVEVADRLVCLRLGEVIYDGPVDRLSELEVLRLMSGAPLESAPFVDTTKRIRA